MDVKQLLTEYLESAKLMQLATSSVNKSWVCSVWFATDNELNIYWFSSTIRRHSDEAMLNDSVAGAIALPQSPDDAPRGVQFEGKAHKLSEPSDVERAKSLFVGWIFSLEKINDLITNRAHCFYIIKPTQYVLFDAANFPDSPQQIFNP